MGPRRLIISSSISNGSAPIEGSIMPGMQNAHASCSEQCISFFIIYFPRVKLRNKRRKAVISLPCAKMNSRHLIIGSIWPHALSINAVPHAYLPRAIACMRADATIGGLAGATPVASPKSSRNSATGIAATIAMACRGRRNFHHYHL